jgi:hypothetical protein
MHFQRGFKSLPEGSITQIFLHSRGVKSPKAEVLDRGVWFFNVIAQYQDKSYSFVNAYSVILFQIITPHILPSKGKNWIELDSTSL